jgi:hypothetical protein
MKKRKGTRIARWAGQPHEDTPRPDQLAPPGAANDEPTNSGKVVVRRRRVQVVEDTTPLPPRPAPRRPLRRF